VAPSRKLRGPKQLPRLALQDRDERLPRGSRQATRGAAAELRAGRAHAVPRCVARRAALGCGRARSPLRPSRERTARAVGRDPDAASPATGRIPTARRARVLRQGGRPAPGRQLDERAQRGPPGPSHAGAARTRPHPPARRCPALAREALHRGLGGGRHRGPRGAHSRGRGDDDAPGSGCLPREAGDRGLLRNGSGGRRARRIPLVATSANRQPAVAAYFPDPEAGVFRPYGIMVLTLDEDSIAEITGCTDPAVFPLLGLPSELERQPAH
jgi:hypothetical protein